METKPIWIDPKIKLPDNMEPVLILSEEFGFGRHAWAGYAFTAKGKTVWFMKYSFYVIEHMNHPDPIISGDVIGWYPFPIWKENT